jgi:hypothetical protein
VENHIVLWLTGKRRAEVSLVQTSLFEEKSTETLLRNSSFQCCESKQHVGIAMLPFYSAPCASANNQGIGCAGLLVA